MIIGMDKGRQNKKADETRRSPVHTKRPILVFYGILILTLLPLVVFPLTSIFFSEIYHTPKIEAGVLDLEGYDFQSGREIPLRGEWEFYWNRWIVTDKMGADSLEPDSMVPVPRSWRNYKIDGQALPVEGYASYRLLLINCPEDIALISYIPNLGEAYRVFLNGNLIATSGIMSKNPDGSNVSLVLDREHLHFAPQNAYELVIEVSGSNGGGLYLAPILEEESRDFIYSRLRNTLVSLYAGILFVTVICFAYLQFHQEKQTFSFLAFLLMNILMLLRILVKDEMFGVLKMLVPFFQYHGANTAIQVLSLFLPVVFLICAQEMWGVSVRRGMIRKIFFFEVACCIPLFWCAMQGRVHMQFYLSLLNFFPYIFVIKGLYQNMKKGVPDAISVFAGMMFTISSLLGACESMSGFIIFNISLFAPTAFLFAVFVEVYLYLKRSLQAMKAALENAHLRIQLKENEMATMRAQIKPHFLYNALLAIQVVCIREPETAAEAIARFSKYLRANMQFITSGEPIPFSKELEHIQNYTAIEQLRFRERLKIKFEIEAKDFFVPPLTIQPLVENAIIHGACKNIKGGYVVLRSRQVENGWCVEIIDDGPGFDPEILNRQEDIHGLPNVIYRLRESMGAQVNIHTGRDKGTRIEVLLPDSHISDQFPPETPQTGGKAHEIYAGNHC